MSIGRRQGMHCGLVLVALAYAGIEYLLIWSFFRLFSLHWTNDPAGWVVLLIFSGVGLLYLELYLWLKFEDYEFDHERNPRGNL